MRFVIQRVQSASIEIEGVKSGGIGVGCVVLAGMGRGDTKETADKMVKKMINLRIFDDENRKANLSLSDVEGGLLLVSQFTLYASCKRGNRPSFTDAGSPVQAEALYDYIVEECKKRVPCVVTGSFGAYMKISLVNDGPFTVVLDDSAL